MGKIINILILDDNELIAECVKKRILKACKTFHNTSDFSLNPFHLKLDITTPKMAGQQVEDYLKENNVDYLLLDRGFFKIVDSEKTGEVELDKALLYTKKSERNIKITEILGCVSFAKIKKLKGVILYTYDDPNLTSEWYIEPEQIKQDIQAVFADKVSSENIEIVLTNSEIYHLANLKLYADNSDQRGDYLILGRKSDFMLYGLFIGEILYHRILKIVERRRKLAMTSRRALTAIRLFIIFIVFTSLNIGANAAYELSYHIVNHNLGLIFISILFSILFPFLVLILKPDWLINIED